LRLSGQAATQDTFVIEVGRDAIVVVMPRTNVGNSSGSSGTARNNGRVSAQMVRDRSALLTIWKLSANKYRLPAVHEMNVFRWNGHNSDDHW
jgi:hypothetical protein